MHPDWKKHTNLDSLVSALCGNAKSVGPFGQGVQAFETDLRDVIARAIELHEEEKKQFTASSPEQEKALDDALGLVKIEFRMHKEDAKELNSLANHKGIPTSVLIRRTLTELLAR